MRKIIVCKLHSGIGNQLFEYNFVNYLCRKYRIRKVFYDISFYLPGLFNQKSEYFILQKKYNINLFLDKIISFRPLNKYFVRVIRKIAKLNSTKYHLQFLPYIIDDRNYKNEDVFNKYRILFLAGVFLDKDLIVEDTLVNIGNKIANIKGEIVNKIQISNSVSIHIRGKQYIEHEQSKKDITAISVAYYQNAVKIIESKIHKPIYFIFSNDEEYAAKYCERLNLKDYQIVKKSSGTDLEHLFIMSKCKHNIILNSTFSWWAAMLNTNAQKIVIAPRYYLVKEHFLHEITQRLPNNNWIIVDN